MNKKYFTIGIIPILIIANAIVLPISSTNYNVNIDPADIRIEPDQLEIEWPEYGPPPIPPNIPPNTDIDYIKGDTDEQSYVKAIENDLPVDMKIHNGKCFISAVKLN